MLIFHSYVSLPEVNALCPVEEFPESHEVRDMGLHPWGSSQAESSNPTWVCFEHGVYHGIALYIPNLR